MKKIWILLVLLILLTGCGAQQTMETLGDDYLQPVAAQMQKISLKLPEDAAVMTLENPQTGKLYLCDGYTVSVQTLDAGDLDKTIKTISGYSAESLQILQTNAGQINRYECVWVSAGEADDQVCRACILDDGNYHYAVTVMADSQDAGKLSQSLQTILSSVQLN